MGWLSRQIVPLNKIIPVLPLVWKNFDIRLFVIIIFVIWLKFTVKFKVQHLQIVNCSSTSFQQICTQSSDYVLSMYRKIYIQDKKS